MKGKPRVCPCSGEQAPSNADVDGVGGDASWGILLEDKREAVKAALHDRVHLHGNFGLMRSESGFTVDARPLMKGL